MEKTRPFFFLCTVVGFLLTSLGRCNAKKTDIHCLKSIKHSLGDPFNSLVSWDFNNVTESSICHFVGIQCWQPDENRVLNISLPNMGLIGEFPQGIRNCTSLTLLDLSNNKLYGTFPSDFSVIIPFIIILDLSSN